MTRTNDRCESSHRILIAAGKEAAFIHSVTINFISYVVGPFEFRSVAAVPGVATIRAVTSLPVVATIRAVAAVLVATTPERTACHIQVKPSSPIRGVFGQRVGRG
jgi:hypothetical protein